MHQMFEGLKSKCKGTVESLKCDILRNENTILEKASNALGAIHNAKTQEKEKKEQR